MAAPEDDDMKKIGVVGVAGGWSSERLADALAERTGFRCLADMKKAHLDLDRASLVVDETDLGKLDALIVKKVGPRYSPDLLDRLEMLRFVHGQGLPVFSAPERILRVLDRLSCTVTLRLHGIPMPATVITERPEIAARAVERLGPCILKPLYSSKARGMEVVEPGSELMERLERFHANGNNIIYVQQMLDLPGRDMGVAFLGGKYLATYARVNNGNSWNTTIHSGGKYEAYDPSPEVIELARRAQEPFGLDFTCVDVVETKEGPLVFEVSAFGGFRGLLQANDIDAAGLYADYVLEKLA
jgi:tetrahydromethanopterin:alpha-L-glutamate ligase